VLLPRPGQERADLWDDGCNPQVLGGGADRAVRVGRGRGGMRACHRVACTMVCSLPHLVQDADQEQGGMRLAAESAVALAFASPQLAPQEEKGSAPYAVEEMVGLAVALAFAWPQVAPEDQKKDHDEYEYATCHSGAASMA
jgi:hypothetical protein